LKKLENSFKWEIHSLHVVAVGFPTWVIYPPVGLAIGSVAVLLTLIMDTAFTILVTLIFLRPIKKIMRDEGGDSIQSAAHKDMQKTKWMTLAGSTLAVLSSTILYIMMMLNAVLGGKFWSSPWLNIFVSGLNIDGILSTIGMVFVSGSLKNASFGDILSEFAAANPAPMTVVPQQSYVGNSEASSKYNDQEVEAVNTQGAESRPTEAHIAGGVGQDSGTKGESPCVVVELHASSET
jgi:hypothetical protein